MHCYLLLPLRIHLLLLVLLLTLPAAGVVTYSGLAQRAAALREATRQVAKLADTIASAQKDLVNASEQLLSTLVLLPDIRNRNVTATTAILSDLLKKNPHYANILIADTSGNLWASAVPHTQAVSHAGYRYLTNAIATGRFSSGEYAMGKITGKRVLHFGYPIKDSSGRITGVAAVALDLEYCRHLLEKARLPARTTLTLIDNDGKILSRSLNNQFIGSKDKESLFTIMKNGPDEGTVKAVGLDGTYRLFAYTRLILPGEQFPYLYIRAGIPEDSVVAKANTALIHNLILLTPFPVISLFIIWFIGKKYIVDRITTLQHAAERLAGGDLSVRVSDLVHGGELGTLGAAFDDMAENLARRDADLRESQRENDFLTDLLDHSSQPFAIAYPDGRLGRCNPAFLTLVGYTSEELHGVDWVHDLTTPEWFASERVKLDELALSDQPVRYEKEYIRKDGSRVPVELLTHLVRNEQGKPLFYYAFITDITERVRMEQALRESEELFRSLCDSAPIGIFMTDGQGNNIYSNPCRDKIAGFTDTDNTRHEWSAALHPEDRNKVLKVWDKATAAGSSYAGEYRLVTPQGKTVWVRVLANPVKLPDGIITGFVGTVEDITDLRHARLELLKSDKLESLGVLAGGIAHDFNNILTAILGNISLAQMHMNDPDALTKRLEEAESAAVRAKGLTRQLLTFSRGGEPVKKFVQIRKLLEEAAGFATVGSRVTYEVALTGDFWVEADEGQLSQVIHNLVLNAVQAMPAGGTLRIVADQIRSVATRKPVVRISVTDSGVGIPEHDLPRIFDPYFTTKPTGNGLGLATCYSIITRHGGTISVESIVGQGSTFLVTLPALELGGATESEMRTEAACGRGRILVMDDEAPVREIARPMLESLGYTAECVANGDDAVKLYRERQAEGIPFAAVILDLTIPGGCGGREALARILEIAPSVKAIVSSGYAEDSVMAQYREYGFSAVLGKPYRLQDMSNVMKELLG